jgi:hypothetical protein
MQGHRCRRSALEPHCVADCLPKNSYFCYKTLFMMNRFLLTHLLTSKVNQK